MGWRNIPLAFVSEESLRWAGDAQVSQPLSSVSSGRLESARAFSGLKNAIAHLLYKVEQSVDADGPTSLVTFERILRGERPSGR